MKPYLVPQDDQARAWRSTTLRECKRDETFLESVIASNPDILCLDPYDTGIGPDVVAFRQTQLQTPTGRTVIPDVVLVSASGHIVMVEVKLTDNPELRDRRVVAQLIEYAACVANLSDDAALEWLGDEQDESWNAFVRRTFPTTLAPERLAAALRRRMRDGEIHLVIACDGVPDGLRELVRAVAGQAALGAFKLHVIEIKPFLADGQSDILLVPSSAARTEIVSRTAITVSTVEGKQLAVAVVASSPHDVADAMADVEAGKTMRPELAAIIERYDAIAPAELRTTGSEDYYRVVRPEGWPDGLHYEFLRWGGGKDAIGVELHCESKKLAQVTAALPSLAMKADATFDPKWARGGGRILRRLPLADADGAARAMLRLIEATRDDVTALLRFG